MASKTDANDVWTGTIHPDRSALMSRVRGANTTPELMIRRSLHAKGFRFRIQRKDLPGRPDIVLPRHKLAIFVHGCFWHRHEGCRMCSTPKTRADFWTKKFDTNVARDLRNEASLRALGWSVLVIWECDTKSETKLAAEISRIEETIVSAIGEKPSKFPECELANR